jgi:hypothetical protein
LTNELPLVGILEGIGIEGNVQTPPLIIPTYTGAALGEGSFSYKLEVTNKSGCGLRKVGTV